MSVDLDRMTYEELLDLNHRVVARLKMLDSMQAHQEMMSFNLGVTSRHNQTSRVSAYTGQLHCRTCLS